MSTTLKEGRSDYRHGDSFDIYAAPDGLTPDEVKTREIIIGIATSSNTRYQNLREALEIYERVEGKTPAMLAMARMLNGKDPVVERKMVMEKWADVKSDRKDKTENNKVNEKLKEGLRGTYEV